MTKNPLFSKNDFGILPSEKVAENRSEILPEKFVDYRNCLPDFYWQHDIPFKKRLPPRFFSSENFD